MPMPEIQGNKLQSTSGVGRGESDAASGAGRAGSYRGEGVVQVPTQASLIQDAFEDSLEELTSSIGEKEEKDFSKRKVEEGKRTDQLDRVLKLKEVQQLVEQLKDLPKHELEKVLEQLLQSKNATARELHEQARQAFKEPAHEYAALKALVGALHEQGAPKERIEAAEGALQQLLEEHGPEVRAGLNVSGAAADAAAEGLGDVQSLRNSYRDAVMDYQGLSQAFDSLASQHTPEELPRAIRFLQQGLAADMTAQGTSIDRSKLNAILNDMYRLEVLSTMLERSEALAQKTKQRGAVTTARGTDLLKEVLAWQDNKWLSPEQVSPLPGKMGIRDIGQEITFLTDFKELVRAIPENAFPDPAQKIRMLDAVQLDLDETIDREEDEE